MSTENKNFPETEEFDEIDDFENNDVSFADINIKHRIANRIQSVRESIAAFFNRIRCVFLAIANRIGKLVSPITTCIRNRVVAECHNIGRRAPLLKTSAFATKFILSEIALVIYIFLCALITTKNDSAAEYMKIFFICLGSCSVITFIGAFLNPYKASSTVYAVLTCILIITGVMLQVMLGSVNEYSNVPKLALYIGLGTVGGLVLAALMVLYLRTSDKRKLVTIIMAALSILFLVLTLIQGRSVNDATNWLRLGGLSFQSGDFVKVLAIAVIASIYSLKEYSEKKRIIIATSYLCILVGFFALSYEFGIPIILVIAFFVMTWLCTNSLKRIMSLCVAASMFLIVALSIGHSVYSNLYNVDTETKETVQSVTTEVYRILLNDDSLTQTDIVNHPNNLFIEESETDKTAKHDYVSYSIYTARAVQEVLNKAEASAESDTTTAPNVDGITDSEQPANEESAKTPEVILDTSLVFTVICKDENAKATRDKIVAYLKTVEKIPTEKDKHPEGITAVIPNDSEKEKLTFQINVKKDLTGTDKISLLIAKSYYKILERLELAGSRFHNQRVIDSMHMTRWFGTENKLMIYVPNQNNDSIFSYALLQLGLAMIIMILVIYVIKFLIVACNSYKIKDVALSMTAIGYGICISIQSVLQLAAGLHMFPIVGITATFLSAGGTNFLASVCMTFVILYSMRIRITDSVNKNEEEVS
ncbi:MAG: FtsW/RodA/SpoVE family cell cycle protein [Clostridia bacterium]|nr:FtsW/RodA/SpoVE family cell cycle protein [Clostridia bacterium]